MLVIGPVCAILEDYLLHCCGAIRWKTETNTLFPFQWVCFIYYLRQRTTNPDGWAVWGVSLSTRWWLLVDHCVLRNWDRILVRAVIEGLISRAGMVSILSQRDAKTPTNKQTNLRQRSWTEVCIHPFVCLLLCLLAWLKVMDGFRRNFIVS